MKITKQEAENIMNMLMSPDEENTYLAFQAIEAHDFTKDGDIGYLLYFYKFARCAMDGWKTNAPKTVKQLEELFNSHDLNSKPLTYATVLTIMCKKKVCKESIELFLERHVADLKNNLDMLGYPIDKLEFSIKLKE